MTGHIRRRGKTSWELKYDVGLDPLTGRRITHYASVKGTRRDAQEALTKLLHARDIRYRNRSYQRDSVAISRPLE